MNNKFDELAKELAQSLTRGHCAEEVQRWSGRNGVGEFRAGEQGGCQTQTAAVCSARERLQQFFPMLHTALLS